MIRLQTRPLFLIWSLLVSFRTNDDKKKRKEKGKRKAKLTVRHQLVDRQLPTLHHAHQHRRAGGVDEPHRHRQIIPPQLLEMDLRALAVHADVGDIAAQRDDVLAQLERGGDADRLDHDVAAELVRVVLHRGDGVGGRAHDVRAHRGRGLQAGRVVVDHDDQRWGVELGGQQGGEADGPGADDGDRFAGGDAAGEDADFVPGWHCGGVGV